MSKLKELLERTPDWLRLYNRKYQLNTVLRMNDVLAKAHMTQKQLAEKAGWTEGYVSRLLSGRQNLTLKTLARFEAAVGAEVLTVTEAAEPANARPAQCVSCNVQAGPEHRTLIASSLPVRGPEVRFAGVSFSVHAHTPVRVAEALEG